MKKFGSLLVTSLFFALTMAAQDESRASKTWEVQKYDIAATLPQSETDRYLIAKAVLNLKNVSGITGSRLTLRISDKAKSPLLKLIIQLPILPKVKKRLAATGICKEFSCVSPRFRQTQVFQSRLIIN